MARLVIGLTCFGIGIVASATAAHAQDAPDDEVLSAAHDANVDPTNLLGAMSSTGLGAREYLYAVHELERPYAPPAVPHGRTARVRLTHYNESGVTASGAHTYAGSTACSWNWPLGTRFRLPDGEVFTCVDRGMLGDTGWLDLWRRPDIEAKYGPYATVEVLP